MSRLTNTSIFDPARRNAIANTVSDAIERQRETAAQQAAVTIRQARNTGIGPEDASRARLLSNTAMTGGRPIYSPTFLDQMETRRQQDTEASFLRNNPRVAAYVSDLDNALLVQDDLDTLGLFEEIGRAEEGDQSTVLGAMYNAYARRTDTIIDDVTSGRRLWDSIARDNQLGGMSLAEIIEDRRADEREAQNERDTRPSSRYDENGDPLPQPQLRRVPSPPAGEDGQELPFYREMSAGARGLYDWIRTRDEALLGGDAIDRAERAAQLRGIQTDIYRDLSLRAADREQVWPSNDNRRRIDEALANLDADNIGDAATGMLGIARDNPAAFTQYMMEISAESGVTLLATLAAGAVTRNPAAVMAVAGSTSYQTSQSLYFFELAAELGYDTNTPEGRAALLDDPRTIDRIQSATDSYALVVGLFDAVSAGAASSVLVDNPVGEFVLQGMAQSFLGGSGEALGRLAAGQEIDWTEVLLEAVAEFTTAPIEVAGLGFTGVRNRAARVSNARRRRDLFGVLSGQVQESELRNRDREAFRAAVQEVTENGPAENMYIDAERLDELFQSGAITREEFFEGVPDLDPDTFEEMLQTGGDVVIPTAVYAARIAGSEVDAQIADYLRLNPNDMSKADADTFVNDLKEAQGNLSEDAARGDSMIGEIDGNLAAELERLTSEIVASHPAITPDAAQRQASLLVAAARTGARRAGMTTETYLTRYSLPAIRNVDTVSPTTSNAVSAEVLLDAINSDNPVLQANAFYAPLLERLEQNGAAEGAVSLEEVTQALRELIDEGAITATMTPAEEAAPTSTTAPGDDEFMQTATLRGGLENPEEWGIDTSIRNKTRDVAIKLQDRQRALYGETPRGVYTDEARERMANWMADEIVFELQTPDTSALGWYGPKFQSSLDIMGQMWAPLIDEKAAKASKVPGVDTVEDARALATALFAVSSNGTKVVDNVENALNAILQLEETGKIETVAHQRSVALNANLTMVVDMTAEMGAANMRDYLTRETTMSEVNKDIRAAGGKSRGGYAASMRVPYAARYLGPKLAAFYANLSGAEGYLTMDLWWTRTINRYRGDVLPRVNGLNGGVDSKGAPVGLNRFKHLIGRPDLTDNQAINYVTEYAEAYAKTGYKVGTDAHKAANTLYKALFVEQSEAPAGAKDRTFMLSVAEAAQAEVARRLDRNVTIADIQALLWYYEKRLYAEMGVRDSGDLSYEEAATMVVERRAAREQEAPDAETLYQTSSIRDGIVDGDTMTGDGRHFTEFFGDVTSGERQQADLSNYEPPIDLPPEVQEFGETFDEFSGNFDDHITGSIPGYREMQQGVAYSISRMLGDGAFLRIGASEGSTVKATVQAAGPGATGVAMDPNVEMKATFDAKPQVEGVTYSVSAFGDPADAGRLEWTEDDGTEIRVFDPEGQTFDVVVEQMVFQFISNERGAQIAATKKLMAEDGLFYTAEKLGGPADQYNRNEAQKDEYKAKHFSEDQLAAKRKEVLETGGDAIEGMTGLQVSVDEMEATLRLNFAFVVQVWDSGNFKGYAASDSQATIDKFLENLPSLDSEFATVETPRPVEGEAEVFFQTPVLPQQRPVRAEEFSPEALRDMTPEERLALFKRPGWFVVTATRDMYGASDSDVNLERNAQLVADLEAQGLSYVPLKGMYKGTMDGTSYLVISDRATGFQMGQTWQQESILTNEGLVYTDGSGKDNVPFSDVTYGHSAAYSDFYSQIASPDALPIDKFALALDFPQPADVTVDDGDGTNHYGARVENGQMVLTHWSTEPRDTLSPDAAGTGDLPGPERRRLGPNKTFFGLHIGRRGGYQRESGRLGRFRHEVRVDPRTMYPWYADPDGLRDRIDQTQINENQIGQYENLIKAAGYEGYFVIGGKLGDTAVMFGDVTPDTVVEDNDAAALRSGAFNNWFSNSVVTNEDGTPMMVYHGTAGDFTSFRRLAHFGTALAARDRLDYSGRRWLEGARTIPAYLNLTNPVRLGQENWLGDAWENDSQMLLQVADTLGDETLKRMVNDEVVYTHAYEIEGQEAERRFTLRQIDNEFMWNVRPSAEWDPVAAREAYDRAVEAVVKRLIDQGYDGIEYVNSTEDQGSTSYVVFDAGQAKSPFNAGNWDAQEADILYQTGATGAPHLIKGDTSSPQFRRWFEGSKAVDADGNPLVLYHGTEHAPFRVFKTDGERKTEGTGAFFTDSRFMAETYTRNSRTVEFMTEDEYSAAARQVDDDEWVIDMPNGDVVSGDTLDEAVENAVYNDEETSGVYEVYLSLRDPLIIDADDAAWTEIVTGWTLYSGMDGEPVDTFNTEAEAWAASDNELDTVEPQLETTDDLARMARDMGTDGLIVRNVFDGGPYSRGGESGDLYVVFDPSQVKSTDNRGAWSAQDDDILQQQRNGSIVLPKDPSAQAVINLFETANLSTVLHETGHFFLWNMTKQAQDGLDFAGEELEVVRSWWMSNSTAIAEEATTLRGVTTGKAQVEEYLTVGTTGFGDVDQAIHTALHEQFARGFEAYAMEGKSPSNALRSIFESFASWLLAWYRHAKNLNVNINDDIRGVFDRLVEVEDAMVTGEERAAVDAQIAETARELGLDEANYRRLVTLSEEARDEGRQLARKEMMATEKRLRSAEYAARLAEIEAEERERVQSQPVHRAIQWLAYGRWLGSETPDMPADLRLDTAILIEEHGEEILEQLPRGRRPVFLKDSGISADDAAGWFGFDSGAEMLQAMTRAPKLNDEVRSATDERARAELQDIGNDPDAIAQTVDEAYHGEKRGQVLVAEMRALNRISAKKGKTTSRSQAKAIAEDLISRMAVRDAIATNRYLAAERRLGEQAARSLAAGEIETAFEYKRKQLIQHQMYIASKATSEMVAKAERLAGRLKRNGTRKNLAAEYLGAIDDILETYDFRKISGVKEARRERLAAYVDMMKRENRENELAIPSDVLRESRRIPYKTLPVRRMRGVYESLQNIEHMARRKQKLIVAQEERDLNEVREEIGTAFDENIRGKPINRVATRGDKWRSGVRSYFNLIRNADTVLRAIDGWRDNGPMYRLFKRQIDDAGNNATTLRTQVSDKLEALFDEFYDRGDRRRMNTRVMWKGYDQALSKWDLISMALNTGNKDNYERLTSRDSTGSFTPEQVKSLLDNLTKADWDFVQRTWDMLSQDFWPMIADREERVTGVRPVGVEPQEVETKFGSYRGGYYPIVYDGRFSGMVAAEQQQVLMQDMMSGRFGKAQTRNGHIESRKSTGGGRTVQLGMHVLFGHLNNVTHDLAFSEAVTSTWKLLQDPVVRGHFERNNMLADHQALEWWVQDVAAGPGGGTHVGAHALRHMKSGFTLSKLAFNMSTVAIQVTGLAQSVAQIGAKNMAVGVTKYVASGNIFKTGAEIKERSTFMEEREQTFNRDMFDLIMEVQLDPVTSRYGAFRKWMISAGFWAMQKVQYYAVDVPTWIGAYEQAVARGDTDAEAGHHADRMVARAQASGIYADRSAVERGTIGATQRQNEFVRLFTALGSYMFAKFNVANEVAGRTARDIRDPNASTPFAIIKGTMDMALLFVIEAVLYNAIKGTLPGQDEEDDDEQEAWAQFLARETALSIASTMPVVRDFASAAQGFSGGGAYGGIAETLGRTLQDTGDLMTDEEFNVNNLRSYNDVVGLLAPGYPSTAVWRALDGSGIVSEEGEDFSPLAIIMGR